MRINLSLLALILGLLPAANAQVAPAAYTDGRPIGVGIGISGYSLDYGPGRWMEGPVVRGSVGLWRGLGIDGSARAIFIGTPSELTRMQQNTFLGGIYYEGPTTFHLRPFVRAAAGLGTIEFPSRNPLYTRDSYSVFAPAAGFEVPIVHPFYLRAEYEYQYWKDFHGPRDLNPNGVTLGVTYYLRGMHTRPHSDYPYAR